MDLNVLGDGKEFDMNRCVEISTGDTVIQIDMRHRHFVKAVGLDNRKDNFAGFLFLTFSKRKFAFLALIVCLQSI